MMARRIANHDLAVPVMELQCMRTEAGDGTPISENRLRADCKKRTERTFDVGAFSFSTDG